MTIHVNSILIALQDLLNADGPLSSFTVEVGVPVNEEQYKLPWIDLQFGGMGIEGHTISNNIGKPWQANLAIELYHQAYSESRDGTTLLTLMAHQQRILTAVSSNIQLDGVVLMLESADSALVDFDVTKDEYFLTNLITLSYEVRG